MSFLLHTARKLELTREVNTKNYQLMNISQQYERATKNVADFQQNMANMKQMTNIFTSGFGQQAIVASIAQNYGCSQADAQAMMNGQSQVADQSKFAAAIQAGQMAGQQLSTMASSVTNSIFDAVNKTKLASLQAQQQSLDLQKEALATEVSMLKETLATEKEAEKESLKDSIVGFGLG